MMLTEESLEYERMLVYSLYVQSPFQSGKI